MNIKIAPVRENLILDSGENNPLWIDWFNSIAKVLGAGRNQQSLAWTPTASALTFSVSGGLTGTYTQKDNLVYFNVIVTPDAGTSTSVLDSTKITNLPKKADGYWFGNSFQETGKVDLGRGFIPTGTTELYLPAWTCTGRVIISGNYLTSE